MKDTIFYYIPTAWLGIIGIILGIIPGCEPDENEWAAHWGCYNEPLRVEFDPLPLEVESGSLVTVYAVVSGGTTPFQFEWEWSGESEWGYGYTSYPSFTFTAPLEEQDAIYAVAVCVRDSRGQTATARKEVLVLGIGAPAPQNRPPTPVSQAVYTAYETPVAINLTAMDPDGDPLSFSAEIPSNGSLEGQGSAYLYTPNPDFSGRDEVIFTVCDYQFCDNGMVVITVGEPPEPPVEKNHPPVANQLMLTTAYETAVNIMLTGFDPDGDPLVFTVETNPVHGVLDGTTPSLIYTPNPGFSGSDSFTYRVSDGELSDTATVIITVGQPENPPDNPTKVNLVPYPAAGTAPLTVTFSANTSYNTGIRIEKYFFDLDGNDEFEVETDSPMVNHTYTAPGTYVPRVKIIDSQGSMAENSASIEVFN